MFNWLQPRYGLWAFGKGGYQLRDDAIRFRRVAIWRARRLVNANSMLSVNVYQAGKGTIWQYSPSRMDPVVQELEKLWRES